MNTPLEQIHMHNRKSIRLPFYDYSEAGYYFITICSFDKKKIFGKIINGKMYETEIGKIVREEWKRTSGLRLNVSLGSFILMPNHIHGIIIMNYRIESSLFTSPEHKNIRGFTSPSNSLGAIMKGFKAAVTSQVNKIENLPSIKIWQKNYYERVIRNQAEYIKIDEYIRRNVELWGKDKFYS